MDKKWQLISHDKRPGHFNMEFDQQLFDDFEAEKIPSTLRFYSWRDPCLSLGYAQELKDKERERYENEGWEIVKRPTGGGMVFHRTWELTYSLVTSANNGVLPHGLVPSYKRISEVIAAWLNELGVKAELREAKPLIKKAEHCFDLTMPYEVISDDRKIVGSAQKRSKKTLLQQGTILIPWDQRFIAQLADNFSAALGIIF